MKQKRNKQKRNKQNILDRLAKDVIVGAEGYVWELERRGFIKAGPYVPEVVLDFPDALRELHREFLLAGSDVMVALTYYANRNKLADVGRENDLEKLNRKAVQIANEVAEETDALVAGNICNTWMYDPDNKTKSSKIVRKMYEEQLSWAVEEGIDFVISETNDYLREALIGLEVIKSFNLPAMVTLATVQRDKTRDGYSYTEACRILEKNGADIVGLNCDHGPKTMLPLIKEIRKKVSTYVAMQPVPYKTTEKMPAFEQLRKNGKGLYPIALEPFAMDRFALGEFAKEAKKIGVNYIGLCCGNIPAYTRSVAQALGRNTLSSKYSPVLELHPMSEKKQQKKDKKFTKDWALVKKTKSKKTEK